MENPFKAIEPDAVCPPHLKEELVSEIDLIRNTLQVVELYSGDLFATVIGYLSGLTQERP
ncbi:MAG: hypothetical protein H7Z72_17665 [Bacteroidetes bacterium]|nr:hypothetical protein [Fibrella sp.]